MKKVIILLVFLTRTPFLVLGQNPEVDLDKFQKIDSTLNWTLQLHDTGTTDWQTHWVLDGKVATVDNSENGKHLKAGPEHGNDAHHAVLWTKRLFEGNLKITYEFTKTDTLDKFVNILYLQASGIDKGPFSKDIFEWNKLREIPKMSTYFENMNALHISYAAISKKEKHHYIRARRYPATAERSFKETMMAPSYDQELGTIKNEITYRITAMKTEKNLFFKVEDSKKSKIFSWRILPGDGIKEGRVGFRNMFGRSSIYKNIKVYTQVDPSRPER